MYNKYGIACTKQQTSFVSFGEPRSVILYLECEIEVILYMCENVLVKCVSQP